MGPMQFVVGRGRFPGQLASEQLRGVGALTTSLGLAFPGGYLPDSRPHAQFRYADGRTLPTDVMHVRAWRIRLAAYGARLERVLG